MNKNGIFARNKTLKSSILREYLTATTQTHVIALYKKVSFSDKLRIDMDSQFENDYDQLRQKILSGKSYSEIRKFYLKLLKMYHPDKAEESKKKLFEEYTVKIVNLYEEYINQKITAAENDFSNQMHPENMQFNKTAAASDQKQNYTYIKLMEIARNEYVAYKKIGYGFVPDPEELKRRSENHLKHLGTAIKCYKTVIKECHAPELVVAAKKQLEWVQRLYDSHKAAYFRGF